MSLRIAIDGPVGSGKSSLAKALATKLELLHVDTGAMYRALGWYCLDHHIDINDEAAVVSVVPQIGIELVTSKDGVGVFVENKEITTLIRTQPVSEAASVVSTYQGVREYLGELQRFMSQAPRVVMEGRDIGSRIMPEADYKFYLDADPRVRAKRRWLQLKQAEPLDQVFADLIARDGREFSRSIDPLRPAPGAIILDTTTKTLPETVQEVLEIVADDSK